MPAESPTIVAEPRGHPRAPAESGPHLGWRWQWSSTCLPCAGAVAHRLLKEGRRLPSAYSTDDGVGLIYRGTEMVEAVAELDGKAAYYAERTPERDVCETRIEPRALT
jgi:hypothetical protein